MRPPLQRVAGEFVGTAFLLATVVGSGIMGERLAAGNTAIALLANSVATGGALIALILTLGPVSGAHFNPLVTLAEVWGGGMERKLAFPYIAAQCAGALTGVWMAHLMFTQRVLQVSTHARGGPAQWFSEVVASFGLLLVILCCARTQPQSVPLAVGGYITAAYWFTASTSFANPAVTLARACSNTFAGIRPWDVPFFIAAQLVGAFAAVLFFRWLYSSETGKERKMAAGSS
ncbi:MAG TPA: MIP/aquaporin family protein [Candidatus Angelobacter sp.]|nr:MIP/aquaporin family protein [Candidatus Angelobacter sp.]